MPKDSRLPGLSANVGIEGLGPGKYVEIDVARACSCGLDVMHDKADGHVTIRPQEDPSNEKLKTWAATRGAGASNSYTDGLLDSVRSRGKK